mgnify:CR=1 FL=1
MAWELDADRPIYAQLVERIQKEIVSGKYQPGEKLPSVRDLAAVAAVKPEYDAESFCRTGAERPDRDTAHQRRTVTEDTELIGNTREQLAAGHVRNFINNMQELGYQREEIRNLFDKVQA